MTWHHNGELVRADYAHEIEVDGSLCIASTELKHSGVYKAVVSNQYGFEEREVNLTANKDGVTPMDVTTSDHTVSSRSIPIHEFRKYVADHELHFASNQGFKDLFHNVNPSSLYWRKNN